MVNKGEKYNTSTNTKCESLNVIAHWNIEYIHLFLAFDLYCLTNKIFKGFWCRSAQQNCERNEKKKEMIGNSIIQGFHGSCQAINQRKWLIDALQVCVFPICTLDTN
ncbi:unnamed protein product [Cuscuta epithymum]|uniref:Uncharacterized protein n=1 Tax=Cuscuta epithymum TaxID=186058 RepID=A0AAV0CSK7_9ASTE|nr:unnamed protein product [Cuscuta epithymum]